MRTISLPSNIWAKCLSKRRISNGMSSLEVRKSFVKYFKDNGHTYIPSSSLKPDDESLLFTTAGMNQFKSIFLGQPDPKWTGLTKAVSYQRCIRAGGKHNDLDDVGHDLHHQTFFEMLGNWSFNDAYDKETACRLAWTYLVDVLKIDPDRLYVTYFGGNSDVKADVSCKEIWKKIGVPEHKIIPCDKDNFWEMGFTGPCGMCTEIHYDRVPGRKDSSHLVNKDNSVIELWNIVFMNMTRNSDSKLEKLPSSHIDTGMGFERIVSVVQNVNSNYDTDLFFPLIKEISQLGNHKYGGTTSEKDSTIRLIADHIRASTMAIADGIFPGGVDAPFVVRKMLRRAFLQSHKVLGMERNSLLGLVPIVFNTLKDGYPYLTMPNPKTKESLQSIVQNIIKKDEDSLWRIINKGTKLYNQSTAKLDQSNNILPGDVVWHLYSAHGIPLSLIADIAKENGRILDLDGFNVLKEKGKILTKQQLEKKMARRV